MDSINLTINDTVLRGAEGLAMCVDDRTIASTPAPIAVSTVGRDRGVRRIFRQEDRNLIINTIPELQANARTDADDSLGLLPPECLMGMSKSLLPLETINNASKNNSHQGTSSIGSYSSKEVSTEEVLATVKKCPIEMQFRTGNAYRPQSLFKKLEEEQMPIRDNTSDMLCYDLNRQSTDSGVGQTTSAGSHMASRQSEKSASITYRGNEPTSSFVSGGDQFKQTSDASGTYNAAEGFSSALDGQKTKIMDHETKTFVDSKSGNSAGVNIDLTAVRSDTKGDFKKDDNRGKSVSIASSSMDKDGTEPLTKPSLNPKFFLDDLMKLSFNQQIKFPDLDFGLTNEKNSSINNMTKESDLEKKAENEVTLTPEHLQQPLTSNEPLMDGPFKLPLIPKSLDLVNKIEKAANTNVNQMPKPLHPANDSTVTDWGPSINFGDSAVNQQSETEWGSSIQFGESVKLPPTPMSQKEGFPNIEEKVKSQSNSREEQSLFGKTDASFNPFEGCEQEIFNGSERFIDNSVAKAHLLEEDKQEYRKENPFFDKTLNISKESYRTAEDTFMNQTIGAYMAARSGDIGSLSSNKWNRERPDIGMPAYSPPVYRRVIPMLKPSEIYSPINIRNIKSKPVQTILSDSEESEPINRDKGQVKITEDSHLPASDNGQSETTEWGPSIQFGDSLQLPPTPRSQKDDFPNMEPHKAADHVAKSGSDVSRSKPLLQNKNNSSVSMVSSATTALRNVNKPGTLAPSSHLQDGSINTTADLSYGNLHRFIENYDNTTHFEKHIMSELQQLEEKKAARRKEQKILTMQKKSKAENVQHKTIKENAETKGLESSVFKVPFPVKNVQGGKITSKNSNLSSLADKPDHSTKRTEDCSAQCLPYDDDFSITLTQCTIEPNSKDISNAEVVSRQNNSNNNAQPSQMSRLLQAPLSGSHAHPFLDISKAMPQSSQSTANVSEQSTHITSTCSSGKALTCLAPSRSDISKHDESVNASLLGQHALSDFTCADFTVERDLHTLCADVTESVLMPEGFAFSTPMPGSRPISNELQEKTILPLRTPMVAADILNLPKKVIFPDYTCVTLSQETSFCMTNLLDRGVKCTILIADTTCRGQRSNYNSFVLLQEEMTLMSGSSRNVKVMFRPSEEGEHNAIVEICATNMTQRQEQRIYTLTLSAFAEKPNIQISLEEKVLHFGSLPWGEKVCKCITLQNNGHAAVPLILSISRKDSALCDFTFLAQDCSSFNSSISVTCPPDVKNNVMSLTLPGVKPGIEPCAQTINVCCRAKKVHDIQNKYLENCEHFQAVLDVNVDLPVNGLHLKDIILLATVGMYKLHVNEEEIHVSTMPGTSITRTLHVVNSGNIPMPVELELSPTTLPFSINSTQIVVPSYEGVPVNIIFSPHHTSTMEKYNVKLELKTPLSCYIVKITGTVKGNDTRLKSFNNEVNFGGVSLSNTKKLSYSFIPQSHARVTIFINGKEHSAFKLLNDADCEIESVEMDCEQGENYDVWLSFCPTEVKTYSCEMVLEIENGRKCRVPLRGYGGRSDLDIKDIIWTENNEGLLNVGRVSPGKPVYYKTTVRNLGHRCAFVKAVIKDLNGLNCQPRHASVVPPFSLLPPGGSTELIVTMFPTQSELDAASFKRHIASIKILYGDEINRQHFLQKPGKRAKQYVKNFDYPIPCTSGMRDLINLELTCVPSPEDTSAALKNSLRTMLIKLIDQSTERTSLNSPRPKETNSRMSPVARPVLTALSQNIAPADRGKDEWTVAPKEVWINGDEILTLKQSVQVINFSSHDIRFETVCGDNLNVFPTKGTVKSKDTTMLQVNVTNRNIASHWYEFIEVLVGPRNSQKIRVNWTNPRRTETKIPTTGPSNVALRSPERLDVGSHPANVNHQQAMFTSVQTSSDKILGPDKAILMTTESGTKSYVTYSFANTSNKPLHWKLFPFLHPYVKDADDTRSLYRVDYDVFKLVPLTGTLQPDENQQVKIEFYPKSKGLFNQCWKIHDVNDPEEAYHSFTIMAKSITNPCRDNQLPSVNSIPEGLSKTSIPTGSRASSQAALSSFLSTGTPQPLGSPALQNPIVTKTPSLLPKRISEMDMAEPTSDRPTKISSSSQDKATPPTSNVNPDSDKLIDKKLSLVEPFLKFPKIPIEGSSTLIINIKNTTEQKAEIVVDYGPKPPFLIRHQSFSVDKGKMIRFPVIFKPRHQGRFFDQLVFKDQISEVTLTGYLEAEC